MILEELMVETNPAIQFTYPEYSVQESNTACPKCPFFVVANDSNIGKCARRCWYVSFYFFVNILLFS